MAANKNPSGKRKTDRKTASMAEEDARALWGDVAKTVKRQSSSRISPVDLPAERAKKTTPVKKPASPTKKAGKISLQPHSAKNLEAEKSGYITEPANLAKPVYAGIDRSSAKKIQQGKMPLEARLDLHGLSQLEARHHLQKFIATALRNGLRNILVITGKGRMGQGVLRTNAAMAIRAAFAIILSLFRHKMVARALYVRLKRIREI